MLSDVGTDGMRPPYQNYAFLNRFYEDSFANSLEPRGDFAEDFLYHMLFTHGRLCERLRGRVNQSLSLAYDLNLVNGELKSRLQDRSWARFDETLCEFKIGVILRHLGFCLDPKPKATGGRTGEWLASKSGVQLFVEVKTPNPPKSLLDLGKVLEHAETVETQPPAVLDALSKPFKTDIGYYPAQQFSPKSLDRVLREAMERFERLDEQEQTEEGKNFSVRIAMQRGSRGVSFIPIGDEESPTTEAGVSRRKRLVEILQGAQKGSNIPSIVVLNDRSHMFDPSVLAGEEDTNHRDESWWGSPNRWKHRSCSAVGIFWESWPAGDQTLAVYHHPAPFGSIPVELFHSPIKSDDPQIIQYQICGSTWQEVTS